MGYRSLKTMLPVLTLLFITSIAPGRGWLSGVEVHAATIQLPQTGQTTCYDAAGTVIACPSTGQDGDLKKGVAWPNPRFTDNSDGTVTDNLTGLIWLKDANCTDTVGGIAKGGGALTWPNSLAWSNNLASGKCGLTDGSGVGDWRLPNITELKSLVDLSNSNPALSAGQPFSNVQSDVYWSSSTSASSTDHAWYVLMTDGSIKDGASGAGGKANGRNVWPVRGYFISKISESFPSLDTGGGAYSGTMTLSSTIPAVNGVISAEFLQTNTNGDNGTITVTANGTNTITFTGNAPSQFGNLVRIRLVVRDTRGNRAIIYSDTYLLT